MLRRSFLATAPAAAAVSSAALSMAPAFGGSGALVLPGDAGFTSPVEMPKSELVLPDHESRVRYIKIAIISITPYFWTQVAKEYGRFVAGFCQSWMSRTRDMVVRCLITSDNDFLVRFSGLEFDHVPPVGRRSFTALVGSDRDYAHLRFDGNPSRFDVPGGHAMVREELLPVVDWTSADFSKGLRCLMLSAPIVGRSLCGSTWLSDVSGGAAHDYKRLRVASKRPVHTAFGEQLARDCQAKGLTFEEGYDAIDIGGGVCIGERNCSRGAEQSPVLLATRHMREHLPLSYLFRYNPGLKQIDVDQL